MKRSGFFLCLMLLSLCVATSRGVAQDQNGAAAEAASPARLFENLGTYQHSISTTSELAQRYFNQGLRWTYGFNHAEAIRAFKEVARIDPNCAMAYWGLALALGPNINAPMEAAQGKEAYAAIQQAIVLARYASEHERAYIEALATRYAADPETADREALNTAYAEAMRQLSERYPNDPDARTLFAAALMNVRPWDYWTPDSQPKVGTLALVAALESVLERFPNHIGAIHYYIHAIEASSQPERALPHARRLNRTTRHWNTTHPVTPVPVILNVVKNPSTGLRTGLTVETLHCTAHEQICSLLRDWCAASSGTQGDKGSVRISWGLI